MRSWGTSWFGSALSALSYAFGSPILFQYCNIIYLIGAAWLPLGIHAIDRWVRLGRRWGLVELAIVLSMQVLGGEPQAAYLLGMAGIGYASLLAWNRATFKRKNRLVRTGCGRPRLRLAVVAIAPVVCCVATLALAQWLPTLRALVSRLRRCAGWSGCLWACTWPGDWLDLGFLCGGGNAAGVLHWLSSASAWPRRLPCRPLLRRLSYCRSSSSSS